MIAPLYDRLGPWHIAVGFSDATRLQIEILRVLELVAAFTLVGYMAAEYRGRVESEYREAVARLIRWGVALAVASEVLRGFDVVQGASVMRAVLLIAATLYGGWLYSGRTSCGCWRSERNRSAHGSAPGRGAGEALLAQAPVNLRAAATIGLAHCGARTRSPGFKILPRRMWSTSVSAGARPAAGFASTLLS